MSSFIDAVVKAGKDNQTVEIQYGALDRNGDSPYRLSFPRQLLFLLSKTYQQQSAKNQRDVFILRDVPAWSLTDIVWWMQACVREASFPLFAIPAHDARFEDTRLLANFMDVPVLKTQLNQRAEICKQGYYSIDDIRVSYIILKEDKEFRVKIGHNIASALSEGRIKNARHYHAIRHAIPQLDQDINEWFEEHRDEIDAAKSARAEKEWQTIRWEARNGLRTLPI